MLTPANKSKTHKIRNDEVGLYHLLLIRKDYDFDKKKEIIDKTIQKFDAKGFEQFKKFKPADITEVEVLHDPKFKPKNTK